MSCLRALLSGSFFRISRFAVFGVLVTLTLAGCAGLFGGDSLHVDVAGIEPLASQGLEMRFNLKLRVQNPNDSPLSFNGISVDLDLNGRPFASGVSDQSGSVPRFAESVISVPVTVPAFTAVGQALALPGAVQSGGKSRTRCAASWRAA